MGVFACLKGLNSSVIGVRGGVLGSGFEQAAHLITLILLSSVISTEDQPSAEIQETDNMDLSSKSISIDLDQPFLLISLSRCHSGAG